MVEFKNIQERSSIRRGLMLDCEVVSERDFRLLGEMTYDVSRDGVLLEAYDLAELDEPVIFSLRLPFSDDFLEGHGRVARIIRGLRETDEGPALGIAFTELEGVMSARLEAALRGAPPPVPARAQRRDYAAAMRDIIRSSHEPSALPPEELLYTPRSLVQLTASARP